MHKSVRLSLLITLSALAFAAADPASAADGYFLIGYGARQKALAGADVADSQDAMALSVNPAGIVGLERQFQVGMTALLPERGYSTQGMPVVLARGNVRSERPIFPVPNDAYVEPIDADSAWGYASYANGGINTAYSFWNFKQPIFAPTIGGVTPLIAPSFGGPFGGGFAGVDLEQGFVSVGYARRFGSVSVGVAPTAAVQILKVQGLRTLAVYSSNRFEFSDNGYDWSVGGGVRAGVEWRATKELRFAFAGSTPMFMSAFGKYSGLLTDAGSFDIPANLTAGAAYDVLPNLTLMADWKHIFYSAIPALGNSSFPILPSSLGSPDGPGFDWRDTDSVAVGVEWRATKDIALRAGYHHSSNPIRARAATLAVLAPAIGEHFIAGGFSYQATQNSSIDFATVYQFKNSITGLEDVPFVAFSYAPLPIAVAIPAHYNTNATVTTWLRGLEFALSWTYKFDPGTTNWLPTHL